jgi:hypothetical protein
MPEKFDIVKLIEKNPITRLSKVYQDKLINRIKSEFTESQQQLFVSSFYCYLNHNCKKDFIINLDDVWKWVGFARKDPAKRLLDKYFTKNIDYKILLHRSVEQDSDDQNKHGGTNKEQILMTVNTFKKFCLKADTKKLLENYDKPMKKFVYSNAKQIKQINPLTKQSFIFNSMSDIYRKYSITSRTILNAIRNKTVCNGFLWEYYDEKIDNK